MSVSKYEAWGKSEGVKTLAGVCALVGAMTLVTAYSYPVDSMDRVVGMAGILYILAGLAVLANLAPGPGRVLGWLVAAAVIIAVGRVLVGLLAGVYGGPELLGGLIAVTVPGAMAVHLIRRGTAVAGPG